MKKTLLLAILLLGIYEGYSQGCIAVRHMACAAGRINNSTTALGEGQWQFTTGYRYLHSYKHFVGTTEQKHRVEEGTDVRNWSHSFDFGLSYAVNQRLSFSLNVPYVDNARSSMYEHYGNSVEANPERKRFYTYSRGIGDMRLTSTYWVLNPLTHLKGNFALGVGIKAPTGDANVQGDFYKLDKNKKEYIQTVNPQTNLSVPDQYAGRIGLNYNLLPKQGFAVSLGGRIEGLPAIDLIGKSEGSRRPGYIVSFEPGLIWMDSHHTLALTVPYALIRNRIKSWSDRQDPAGLRHGDAAFADYFISATYSYRF
ncbi:MAG: hypothetical protein MUF45_13015 [Spirosomaceae bacterium]|nr:hypothetical protein [Spirosomataceae bacterium]